MLASLGLARQIGLCHGTQETQTVWPIQFPLSSSGSFSLGLALPFPNPMQHGLCIPRCCPDSLSLRIPSFKTLASLAGLAQQWTPAGLLGLVPVSKDSLFPRLEPGVVLAHDKTAMRGPSPLLGKDLEPRSPFGGRLWRFVRRWLGLRARNEEMQVLGMIRSLFPSLSRIDSVIFFFVCESVCRESEKLLSPI